VSQIHLSSPDGKNARVHLLRGRPITPRTVKVTPLGEEIGTKTVHRGNSNVDPQTLDAETVIHSDTEIDFSNIGRLLPDTSRAYRRPGAATLEGNFQVMATTYGVDGAVRARSPYIPLRANINEVAPVRMGRRVPLSVLFRRYVFHTQLCLGHEDGLQHGFLLAIARDLESTGEAVMLGAGLKADLPLILRNSGSPSHAFLVGETDGGEKYRLRVLLTRMELKIPATRTISASDD
jgi:hypothetical protein